MKTGGEERRCCSPPSAASCSTSDRPPPPPLHQVLNSTCNQSDRLFKSKSFFRPLVQLRLSLSPGPQHVDARSLSSLCGFLWERRPLLVSLNHCHPQDLNRLPYATLRSLRVNTLVHALLRVTHTHISTGECVTGTECQIQTAHDA